MRVGELWRYPVKSLRGERLTQLELACGGIPGDRSLHVADRRRPITARRAHDLLGLEATLDARGEVLIDGAPWESDSAAAAVRAAAGETARLRRSDGGHAFDAAPILMISDGSLGQLGLDPRRFRANVLIEGVDAPAELDWVGRTLRIGDAKLLVEQPCERCVITTIDPDTLEVDPQVLRRTRAELAGLMGVYCSVLEPGSVSVGDPVEPL